MLNKTFSIKKYIYDTKEKGHRVARYITVTTGLTFQTAKLARSRDRSLQIVPERKSNV